LPPVSRLTEFSETVAIAVAKKALEQGLAQTSETDMEKAVRDLKWFPKY